tara:strand:+ start:524 stop:751 length:228 start_codon:yes stop_codon:yes gene_type:complete
MVVARYGLMTGLRRFSMKVGDLVRRLNINGTRFGKETCIGLIVEENGGGYKIKWHEKKFAITWSSHHSLEIVSKA